MRVVSGEACCNYLEYDGVLLGCGGMVVCANCRKEFVPKNRKSRFCEDCKMNGITILCPSCNESRIVSYASYLVLEKKTGVVCPKCASAARKGIKGPLRTDAAKAKQRASLAKYWVDPENHVKASEKRKEVWAREGLKEKQSVRMKEVLAQADVRERHLLGLRRAQSPESLEKRSETNKRNWANLEYRERHIAAIRKSKASVSEERQREINAKISAGWTPAARQARSEKSKKLWMNNVYRDTITNAQKKRWQSEGVRQEYTDRMLNFWCDFDRRVAAADRFGMTGERREAFITGTEAEFWQFAINELTAKYGECTLGRLSEWSGVPVSVLYKVAFRMKLTGLTYSGAGGGLLQQSILSYVQSIYSGAILTDRYYDFLRGDSGRAQQLDIYIPEKKVAIEVNGTYWHSEQQGKDSKYHYTKSKLCREAGIRLIHVWEHEWHNSRQKPILESIIKSALGLATTVYARKLAVEYRQSVEMRDFFDTNNIQGFRGGEFAVCLVDPCTKEVLLAYLIGKGNHFSKGYSYEVIRGACKLGYNIVGGFSKAFKHLFADHPEIDNLVYYIDYNYFDGKSLQRQPEWRFKSEQVSFKNYFVDTGEVRNRNPGRHKEIVQGYADGSILKLWTAGVASYVCNRSGGKLADI